MLLGRSLCHAARWLALLLGVSLMLPLGMAQAETNTAFTAQYEHRAQVETELLAQAQALPPAARQRGAALERRVEALQGRLTSLYGSYEAVSAVSAKPQPPARLARAMQQALRAARSDIAAEIADLRHAPGHTAAWRARATDLVAAARAAQQQLDGTMSALRLHVQAPGFRRSAALQLDALQPVIAQLQTTAISLIDAWLVLADTAWAQSQPVAIEGLAYATHEVAIPAKGQGPAVDPVGVQPKVTDASGQVMPDTGTYNLRGPARLHGVSIDRLTGSVTVGPHATPGTYAVTYTQDHAKERVTLRVIP